MKCVYCECKVGREVSESDDGMEVNKLYHCDGCNKSFVIREGELIDEWFEEVKKDEDY